MIRNKSSHWFRKTLLVVLVIFSWEFSFPYHAAAQVTQAMEPNEETILKNQEQTTISAATETVPQAQLRLPVNADKPQPVAKKSLYLTVTAYSSTVDQCGSTPFVTASGTKVRDGVIAANFLPIGTRVRLPDQFGNKVFVVEDRMAARFSSRADIWMPTREDAKQWGIRHHIRMEVL